MNNSNFHHCIWQFEWAWQHPHSSRRLSHVSRRSRKESSLQFHWRVVSNMLRVAPWNRLPLTARWLKQEYRMDFEPSLQPPLHIPIAFGSVRAKKTLPLQSAGEEEETSRCFLCKGLVKVESLQKSFCWKIVWYCAFDYRSRLTHWCKISYFRRVDLLELFCG